MVLQLCMSQSTAHGIGNIANEPHKSGKVIWFFLTILTLIFFIYHASLLYGQLLEESVLVSTHQFAIDFIQPDLLFCSERIFARDYINDPPTKEYEYMKSVSQNIQNFDKLYQRSGHNLTALIWDSLDWHQLYKAFYHRKHELFLRLTCNLRVIDVSLESMNVEMNFRYFACFRFNSSACKLKTPFDNLVIKLYTYIYGTNITYSKLNVFINNRTLDTYVFDQKDAIDEMEDGVHIFFLRPNEGISSSTLQVTATVNAHTYIKMTSTKFVRIPTSKFRCQDKTTMIPVYNLLEKNILNNPINITEDSNCFQILFQKYLYSRFNCVSTKFPIPRYIPPNFKFCGNLFTRSNKSIDYMSLWTNSKIIRDIIKSCNDRRVCSIIVHRAFVNYNDWPRMSTLRNLFGVDVKRKIDHNRRHNHTCPGLIEAHKVYVSNPENIDKWKRNFIKVSISPGEFSSTLVEESLSYAVKNFFSDIGGIMGFYMGGSLLTVCEIFRLLHYFIHWKMHSKKPDQNVEAQQLHDIPHT